MNPKEELTKQYLMRADDDLRVSEIIIHELEPIYWAAAFHAQQCAEKALKALLTFHDIRAGKTHSIEELLKLCRIFNKQYNRDNYKEGCCDDL